MSRAIAVEITGDAKAILRREQERERHWERREANRIDISEPLRQIAELLGVKYDCTAEFKITPDRAVVTCFHENENGKKHVNDLGHACMYEVGKDVRT